MPSPLVLYGSSVADATLATACDMANASGGTETSVTSTIPTTSNQFAEILSQVGTSNSVTAIPATPTGHGWLYKPGQGTFDLNNWSASVTLSALAWGTAGFTDVTIRFFKWDTSTYTSIGTINVGITSLSKTTYAFTATSMPSVTTTATDYIYTDLWWHDTNANVGNDNPVVYVSTTSTAGVANDMQVTTSNFTPFVPPPPVVLLAPPLPFNQALLPVVTGASRFIYGDNL
jgi:hypothetical protein